jgi:uncharacterized membrane protein (UPF0127 family)
MIDVLKEGERLCKARLANTFFSRFKGLMLKKTLKMMKAF